MILIHRSGFSHINLLKGKYRTFMTGAAIFSNHTFYTTLQCMEIYIQYTDQCYPEITVQLFLYLNCISSLLLDYFSKNLETLYDDVILRNLEDTHTNDDLVNVVCPNI